MKLIELETDIAAFHIAAICEYIRDTINDEGHEIYYPKPSEHGANPDQLPINNEFIMGLIESEFKRDFILKKRKNDIMIMW